MGTNTWRSEQSQRLARCSLVLSLSVAALAGCGGSASSGSAAGGGTYCDKAKVLTDLESRMDNVDPGNLKGLAKEFSQLSADVKDAAESAPAAIRPEWDRLSSTVEEIATVVESMKNIDFTDPSSIEAEDLQKLETLGAKAREVNNELTEAGDRIDEFTSNECGFNLSS
jgi:hypothetical protein